jgi:hypothetical protein
MWFFGNYRAVDAADAQPGIFANKNAGDPTKWTYEPDMTRQGRVENHRKIYSLRLTTQLTPKNKLMVFWDEQPNCSGASVTGDDNCNSQKEGWIYGGSQVNGFFGPGPNSPETGDYASTHQKIQQETRARPPASSTGSPPLHLQCRAAGNTTEPHTAQEQTVSFDANATARPAPPRAGSWWPAAWLPVVQLDGCIPRTPGTPRPAAALPRTT